MCTYTSTNPVLVISNFLFGMLDECDMIVTLVSSGKGALASPVGTVKLFKITVSFRGNPPGSRVQMDRRALSFPFGDYMHNSNVSRCFLQLIGKSTEVTHAII